MRNIFVVNQSAADPYNVQTGFVEVYWVPVNNANLQQPLPNFQSAVPLQSTAPAGSPWATFGATAAEITALQLGQVREFPIPITFPNPAFTDAGASATVDAFWRALFAKVNGGTSTVAPAGLPSSVSYIAANAQVTTTSVAAGSNGAALPQATLNVTSTAPAGLSAFPSAGTIYVPAIQTSGPQAGQIVPQAITYTNITGTTFTGCAGGVGTLFTGPGVNGYLFTQG